MRMSMIMSMSVCMCMCMNKSESKIKSMIGMSMIDRFGRRPLVLSSLVGVIAALALEGSAFAVDVWYCRAPLLPEAGSSAVAADEEGSGQPEGICSYMGVVSLLAMVASRTSPSSKAAASVS